MYSTHNQLKLNILDGYDTDEQCEMLEYWRLCKRDEMMPIVQRVTEGPSVKDGE